NAVFWIFLLIFCFSLLKYTYYYNYRSHISLQVAKLGNSAGVQILIFPTVHVGRFLFKELLRDGLGNRRRNEHNFSTVYLSSLCKNTKRQRYREKQPRSF